MRRDATFCSFSHVTVLRRVRIWDMFELSVPTAVEALCRCAPAELEPLPSLQRLSFASAWNVFASLPGDSILGQRLVKMERMRVSLIESYCEATGPMLASSHMTIIRHSLAGLQTAKRRQFHT